MPAAVARWFKISGKPLDRPWWEACKWPSSWTPRGKCILSVAVRNGNNSIVDTGTLHCVVNGEERDRRWWIGRKPATGELETWDDGSPRGGVVLIESPPAANLEIIYDGKTLWRGQAVSADQHMWIVVDAR